MKKHIVTIIMALVVLAICVAVFLFLKAFAEKPFDSMDGGFATEILSAFL